MADVARRFGVSIKALRLYEDQNLLRPARDGNGWRSYGRTECERLHQIVALRELGLSLAAIASLLRDGGYSLADVLALQEQALVEQRAKADEALAIVRRAKARISAGEALDADALAELVRRTKGARLRWTPELGKLADETFSEDQRRRLAASQGPDLNLAWAEIYKELAILAENGDPRSAEALDLGRRAWALIDRMADGDLSTRRAMEDFWTQGLADPSTAKDLPMTQAQWAFLHDIIAQLHTQAEMAS